MHPGDIDCQKNCSQKSWKVFRNGLAEFAATVGGECNQICFSPRHVRGEKLFSGCNCASEASAGSSPQPFSKKSVDFFDMQRCAAILQRTLRFSFNIPILRG